MPYMFPDMHRFTQHGRQAFRFGLSLFSTQMTPFTFFLDFYAYPVLIFATISIGYYGMPLGAWWFGPALVVFGYFSWTLVEYFMHRYAFHHMPGVMALHLAHHRDVSGLIGTPTILSFMLIFTLAYLPMAYLIGAYAACFWFAGMMAGYLAFAGVHFLVHHASSHGLGFMRKLKRLHAIHHHGNNDTNFGVTTLFWDRVFGTYCDKLH